MELELLVPFFSTTLETSVWVWSQIKQSRYEKWKVRFLLLFCWNFVPVMPETLSNESNWTFPPLWLWNRFLQLTISRCLNNVAPEKHLTFQRIIIYKDNAIGYYIKCMFLQKLENDSGLAVLEMGLGGARMHQHPSAVAAPSLVYKLLTSVFWLMIGI